MIQGYEHGGTCIGAIEGRSNTIIILIVFKEDVLFFYYLNIFVNIWILFKMYNMYNVHLPYSHLILLCSTCVLVVIL